MKAARPMTIRVRRSAELVSAVKLCSCFQTERSEVCMLFCSIVNVCLLYYSLWLKAATDFGINQLWHISGSTPSFLLQLSSVFLQQGLRNCFQCQPDQKRDNNRVVQMPDNGNEIRNNVHQIGRASCRERV